MDSIIANLPEREKKAFALCGITQDEQLKNADIKAIIADLHQAREFFPEVASALTDARVQVIYDMVCKAQDQTAPLPNGLRPSNGKKDEEELDRATVVGPIPVRAFPPLVPKHHQHRGHSSYNKAPENEREAPGRSHSVRCIRPIATYIAALSMVLFYAGVVCALLIPALLFMGYIEENSIIMAFLLCAAATIPYALHGAWVGCSVCNMKFFMLRHYNLNRHAHKMPVLEWTTLPTALHIIFLLWYRCPACGTSLRLYRHRSR